MRVTLPPLHRSLVRLVCAVAATVVYTAADPAALYNPDPNHIWNRVHRVLHVRSSSSGREYGWDELDPLLWPQTRHLLTGESHRQALLILDEFLSDRAERLITDPLRRAIFQHDLWSVFAWSDSPNLRYGSRSERRELQIRLAEMIQRVALSRTEIDSLPDNLVIAEAAHLPSLANLPFDLLRESSPWTCVFPSGGGPPAPVHSEFFRQSAFLVFLRLPGGRSETRAYLKRLNEFPQPWILEQSSAPGPFFTLNNPSLPQFPSGTQVVLLRQMMLLDADGEVVPTHLTEAVQRRTYKTVPHDPAALGQRDNFEFRLSRQMMFAGESGGIRPIAPDELGFSVFMTQGDDWFDESHAHGPLEKQRPILNFCVSCHEGSGIHSVRTYTQPFGNGHSGPSSSPGLFEAAPSELIQGAIDWARPQRHDWGLLQGLWSR